MAEVLTDLVTADETTGDHIRRLLPEIDLIEDSELAAKVVAIWDEAWSASSWDRLEEVPKNPETVLLSRRLIEHTRCVATQAIAMSMAIGEFHGFEVNRDWVIAGSLLHDVSKLLEFAPDGGGSVPGTSPVGNVIQHGVYGVHLGLKHDLPLEVVHIIGSHTIQSRLPPRTREAIIVHYADYVDSDVLLLESGKRLFISQPR